MTTDAIKQTYALWKNAVINGDVERLAQLYSESFLWTNNMGITDCKTKTLRKASSCDIQYVSWEDENISVYFDGENAILKSTQILKLKVFGHSINTKLAITVQFINDDERWLLEAINQCQDHKQPDLRHH